MMFTNTLFPYHDAPTTACEKPADRYDCPQSVRLFGNKEILNLPTTAFMCSRRYPAAAVLPSYDWAIAQRESGQCIVSGFHSQLERDVLHYLLKGRQAVVIVLARGLKAKYNAVIHRGVEEGRILIASPFDRQVTRVTPQTAMARNRLIMEMADKVVVGYATPEGVLTKALKEVTHKPILKLA